MRQGGPLQPPRLLAILVDAIQNATIADLVQAKGIVGHGRWLPWLSKIDIPATTATDYMREAKSAQPKVGKSAKKPDRIADLAAQEAMKANRKETIEKMADLKRQATVVKREKVRAALIDGLVYLTAWVIRGSLRTDRR